MRNKPIIFSPPMAALIRDGRKTQTRRPWRGWGPEPYQVGGLLWVRERFEGWGCPQCRSGKIGITAEPPLQVCANCGHEFINAIKVTKPSIHMPLYMTRLWLRVTAVRKARLQGISAQDAEAEGFASREAFFAYWDKLYSGRAIAPTVDTDPWVWVIEFEVDEDWGDIDA